MSFDEVINRRDTGSLKWDVEENELPMWVADMDFKTAPEITKELVKIAGRGVYGYAAEDKKWAKAYKNWWEKRHGFSMREDRLQFTEGVVPIISSAVRALTDKGDNVVLQTPVYNIFFNSIINNKRNVLENPLKYENGRYSMDFQNLEEKLKEPKTTLMLLCNPQNPAGIIWTKDELLKVGCLCEKYSVTVISDEIHCDITDPGKDYIPFASVSDVCRNNSITCISPTKAFNLAGIKTAAFYAENERLFEIMRRAVNTDEVAEPNIFAQAAAITAFNEGERWLEGLKQYIFENKRIAESYIEENIPKIKVYPSEATYLLWLDCKELTENSDKLYALLRKKTGLFLSRGSVYGGNGKYFLRMNIACPKSVLSEGLKRLKDGVTELYV